MLVSWDNEERIEIKVLFNGTVQTDPLLLHRAKEGQKKQKNEANQRKLKS
jgi:hypothetical protein